MSATDALKTFFAVLGVVVAIPILLVTMRAGVFIGKLTRTVESLEKAAAKFTDKVDTLLEKLGDQCADHETRLTIVENYVEAEKIRTGRIAGRRAGEHS